MRYKQKHTHQPGLELKINLSFVWQIKTVGLSNKYAGVEGYIINCACPFNYMKGKQAHVYLLLIQCVVLVSNCSQTSTS